MTKNILAIVTIICLISACGRHYPSDHNQSIDEKFTGIWKSQGYGYIVTIQNNDLQIYDVTQNFCLKQKSSSDEIKQYYNNFEYYDRNNIGFARSQQSKVYKFTRISRLPQTCYQAVHQDPQTVFEYFTELMSEHYAFFDLYDVDWEKRVSQAQNNIRTDMTDQELAEVFDWLIQDIHDGHLYIHASIDDDKVEISNDASKVLSPALDKAFKQQSQIASREDYAGLWYQNHVENVFDKLVPDAKVAANNQIIWGKLGDIGYINILNMHGLSKSGSLQDELNAINKAFKKIINELASSSSIIIDLTSNSGGADEIGRAIVNYFTTDETLLYSHSVFASSETQQRYYSKSGDHAVFLAPVYIYTSDHTVSAAETFTMAMRALPNVKHIGTTTRGAFSDILDKTLPNGWEVGLSNMSYFDANGHSWESKGLKPEIEVPVFSGGDIFNSHLEATKNVVALIKAKY